ncbi:hypothetical protein F5888DRAFT_1658358 [Russula emetica]|nr:hypothetical protein F5888DRAFT_1658358 [Russula emetica]
MTAPVFDRARQRGTADKVRQLNPIGRYDVAAGTSLLYPVPVLNVGIANAGLFLAPGPSSSLREIDTVLISSHRRFKLCGRSSHRH